MASGSPNLLPALGGAPYGHISDPDRGARARRCARRHGVRRRLRRCLADHRTQHGGDRGAQRPGHRSREPERGGRGGRDAQLVRRRQQRDPGEAQGPHRRLQGAAPGRDDRDRDAPGRHRRRQPRQDPARHGRHARHLLLQLGLAPAGPQPGRHAGRPVRRGRSSPTSRSRTCRPSRRPAGPSSACRRRAASAAASSTTARSTATSGSRSPRRGPSSRRTTTRSSRTARRRRSAPRSATPGPPSCSSSPTSTTSRSPNPTFAEEYTANKAHYADTPAAQAGFAHLQEAFEKDWWQEDFGADTFDIGQQKLAEASARTTRC